MVDDVLSNRHIIRQYTDVGLKLSHGFLTAILAAADASVVLVAMLGADFLYHQLILGIDRVSYFIISAYALSAIAFVSLQYMMKGYEVRVYSDIKKSIRLVFLSWIGAFFIIGWIGFLTKVTEEFSRAVFSTTFVFGLLVVILLRLAMTRALSRWLELGRVALRKAYLVHVGDDTECDRIVDEARAHGVRIVGSTMINPADLDQGDFASACRTLLANIRSAFFRTRFDEIYIAFPWTRWPALNPLRAALAELPLPSFVLADRNVASVLQARRLEVGQVSGFEVQRAPLTVAERFAKRALDTTVAAAALVLLAPLLALVSLAIMFESGRPTIFRQERKGFCGKPFTIYKFRTMWVQEAGDDIIQATQNDPRVTRLGALFRRTSIDEVPQLLNVLKGEMSIVGPRPHAIAHDNYYDDHIASYAYRHHGKPGLTGWAQIHGFRGETKELESMAERVELDLWYLNNWSIWLDLQIILRTITTLPFDHKAY